MSSLSLVLIHPADRAWPSTRVLAIREALEARVDRVEVIAATGPDRPFDADPMGVDRVITSGLRGKAAIGVEAMKRALGDFVIVVDLDRPYQAVDVGRVADRLMRADDSVVVGARRGVLGGFAARRIFGSVDPASGLIGVATEALDRTETAFRPVGERLACEILGRVDGPRSDVMVAGFSIPVLANTPLDDLRHFKRLADDRFGNLSRLLQFCFVGASGMVVDLSSYAALQAILGKSALAGLKIPLFGQSAALAVSAVMAIALAMTWNFSLNRRLTFNDARRGSMLRQFARYALSNLLGCGVSLTLRLALPSLGGFFADHRLAAAVAGIVAATGLSFAMARWFVFGVRPKSENSASPDRLDHPAGRSTRQRTRRTLHAFKSRGRRHRKTVGSVVD